MLRYGENPHQAAALYVVPGADPLSGPLASGATPIQGKPLSYNNLLDAAAAAGLARDLRGAALVIVKHGNPCGAAEADDLVGAWEGALSGDPVSAFGGVVAVKGVVDRALAERLASIFLEVVVACAFDTDARAILAAKTDLRLLEDPGIVGMPIAGVELRSAGGAVLATDADVSIDLPQTWTSAGARSATTTEMADLDLAWRVCRHVRSNAIVLVKDGVVVGVGAGQMSRVDSARLAVDKAGPERARGAVCASDAFFPFPDALEVCAAAGVTAFAHPGRLEARRRGHRRRGRRRCGRAADRGAPLPALSDGRATRRAVSERPASCRLGRAPGAPSTDPGPSSPMTELVAVEGEQPALGEGRHRRRPRRSRQQADLTERVRRPDLAEGHHLPIGAQLGDAEAPLRDEVEPVRWLALVDDDIAGRDGDLRQRHRR